jgi:hypothetical protein
MPLIKGMACREWEVQGWWSGLAQVLLHMVPWPPSKTRMRLAGDAGVGRSWSPQTPWHPCVTSVTDPGAAEQGSLSASHNALEQGRGVGFKALGSVFDRP